MYCDTVKDQAEKIGIALARDKDKHIAQSITEYLGHDKWKIKDIAGRGQIKQYPNRTEVFELDGVELIKFSAVEYVADGFKITATFSCVKLYKSKYIKP